MASAQQSKKMAGLDALDDERAQTVRQALMNIISTDLAEFTYAQILDGLPTQQTILDSCQWTRDHPACQLTHDKLCDGFLEKVCEFRSGFDSSTLRFGEDVIFLSLSSPVAMAYETVHANLCRLLTPRC